MPAEGSPCLPCCRGAGTNWDVTFTADVGCATHGIVTLHAGVFVPLPYTCVPVKSIHTRSISALNDVLYLASRCCEAARCGLADMMHGWQFYCWKSVVAGWQPPGVPGGLLHRIRKVSCSRICCVCDVSPDLPPESRKMASERPCCEFVLADGRALRRRAGRCRPISHTLKNVEGSAATLVCVA